MLFFISGPCEAVFQMGGRGPWGKKIQPGQDSQVISLPWGRSSFTINKCAKNKNDPEQFFNIHTGASVQGLFSLCFFLMKTL